MRLYRWGWKSVDLTAGPDKALWRPLTRFFTL
jgi:hypothetical protein